MSEYQYYEFQAIDRPLNEKDRQALRNLSTRARITATSFTNTYDWGDFKGDPVRLMEQWFDLHLHVTSWGSRRLMIRWPERMIDCLAIESFLGGVDCVRQRIVGGNLILDICGEDIEAEDWDDGSGWLAAMTPLRGDVLAGDLRLFYFLWLMAVDAGACEPDELEPLPGIGPLTGALEAFAEFFQINPDLVAAAAERPLDPIATAASEPSRAMISGLPEETKTRLLTRLFEGDPHVALELKSLVRQSQTSKARPVARRTVGKLRARADATRRAREREERAKLEAEARQRAEEAERLRRARLDAVKRRGESVWREIANEIDRRNASAYDRAASLLVDLRTVAEEAGALEDFRRRLNAIRARHARKERFIDRLKALG